MFLPERWLWPGTDVMSAFEARFSESRWGCGALGGGGQVAYEARPKQPTHQHLLRKAPAASREAGLQAEGVRRAFLSAVDGNGDGVVDRAEWATFIGNLRQQRLVYLKQYLLIRRHCYYGLGLRATEPYLNPLGLVSRGWLLRGWLEDYWWAGWGEHARNEKKKARRKKKTPGTRTHNGAVPPVPPHPYHAPPPRATACVVKVSGSHHGLSLSLSLANSLANSLAPSLDRRVR